MGDEEKYGNKEELIDVSEFESEFDEDALTEIEREEEVTPIKERVKPSPPKKREPARAIKPEPPKRGTFIATLRERFAAFFIDTLVLFYLYWILALFYGRLFLGSWQASIPFSGWHGLALHGAFLLLCFLYYFMLEGIFLATIGKFVCWMSVRKKNFEPVSLVSTFIRNIFRPLDYILIIPVVFLMEATKYTQRIGDILGQCTVVKKFGTIHEPYDIGPERFASASGRTVAIIVDLVLFGLFTLGYVMIWNPTVPLFSQWLLLLMPLVMLTYFVLIEMSTETSPGKWLMGYIVCHDNGRRLTISGSIIRTIWRLLDTNPAGLLCIFISSTRQRPGDLSGGTVVIKRKRTVKGAISMVIAVLLMIITLYVGSTNETNIFSPKFRMNFMPKLPLIKELGAYVPEYEKIALKNFRFAAEEPTNIRTPPTYRAGEIVYFVFELFGYTKRDRKVWLQEDLQVRYPDGSVGLRQDNIVNYRQVVKGRGPIELTNNIALPKKASHGAYLVTITIRDKFAGTEITETKKFYVRPPILRNYKKAEEREESEE